MGIKGEISKIVVGKTIEKLTSSGKMDDAINSLLNKAGRISGMNSSKDYIENSKSENYLIIKSRSFSIGNIAGLLSGKLPENSDTYNGYRIYDKSEQLKYCSNTKDNFVDDWITDRDIINIYDCEKQKIGQIKEHVINIGVPLIEKDVKKCSIKLYGEKICVLKKYKSFGECNFEAIEGNIQIKHTNGNKFEISRNHKLIFKINTVPVNLNDGYIDRFVIEYDDINVEKLAVLIAIGIDLINE